MSSNLEQFKRHIAEQAAKKGIPEEQALRKFKSFDEYTAEASDKLGLPADADQCRAYASIKLSLDKVLEDQMVNKPIDPADHLKLIEALQRLLPQEPAREHTVETARRPLLPEVQGALRQPDATAACLTRAA